MSGTGPPGAATGHPTQERRERQGRGRRPGGRARGGRALPRGPGAVRRGGPPAADRGRLQARPRRGRDHAPARPRPPRRRGVRPSLGRIARPGAAARRTGDPPGARPEGRRPVTVDLVLASVARPRPASPDDDGVVVSADRAAAERLLARNARSLARVADPRQRRQRAYALLARNGFDPEVCRSVAAIGRCRTDEVADPERRRLTGCAGSRLGALG